jgi:hypothetical protein
MRTLMPLLALAPIAWASACTPPNRDGGQAAVHRIEGELDDLHSAAAVADEERYFGHFDGAGVFLGTDATERWDVAAFRAYAHPRFSAGKGWVYRVKRRAVTVGDDGATAWFDEDLVGERAGPTRGSGVLVKRAGRWLIAQYNLAFTVPNDRFDELRKVLASPPEVDPRAR